MGWSAGRSGRGTLRGILPVASLALGIACAHNSVAAPRLAIHPALPYALDEVFIANYNINCGTGFEATRVPIPAGYRIEVRINAAQIVFGGEQPYPCLRSIGVLGPGRHEIVALPDFDEPSPTVASALETTIVTIPDAPRPPAPNMWTYVPSSLTSVQASGEQTDAIVRLFGDRFAAIVHDVDRDFVTVFGKSAGDWRHLDRGFPGAMVIRALYADAVDTLYALAWPRVSDTFAPALWRFDGEKWQRHADLPDSMPQIVGVLRDGTVIATTFPPGGAGAQLMRFTPVGGWQALAPFAQAVTSFARGPDDTIYGLTFDGTPHVLRFSPTTGEVESDRPLPNAAGFPLWLETDPAGGLVAIGRNWGTETRYTIDRIDGSGAMFRLVSDAVRFPLAASANGEYFAAEPARLMLRTAAGTATPIAVGGLGPSPICGDVSTPPSAFAPFFNLCTGSGNLASGIDQPRNYVQQVNLGGVYYTLQAQGNVFQLMRRASSTSTPELFLDLTPAIAAGPPELYAARAMRIVATPDWKRLYLLVHQYLNGDGYSARIVEIDLATKAASAIALPAVLTTDMTMSPNGNLYVTTRFGEVLRRDAGATVWMLAGSLSTAHIDVHPVVNGAERIFVYGLDGMMASQGTPARVEEFHHVGLDHYFMTANAAEAASLRAQPAQGWTPTGASFPVIAANAWGFGTTPAPRPVCRFYGSIEPGPNSHFYTVSQGECATLRTLELSTPPSLPRWNYEGTAFLSLAGTAGGNCPETEKMLVRWFNGGGPGTGKDPNHRYVSPGDSAAMTARGWILEFSALCVPYDVHTRVYAQ